MSQDRAKILSRFYFFSAFLLLFSALLWAKMTYIALIKGDAYKRMAEQPNIKNAVVPADRGNLYTEAGDLLATTLIKYDVRIDLKAVDKRLFEKDYKALAKALATLPHSPPAAYYRARLLRNYRGGNRYLLLKRDLDYAAYRHMCRFPILRRGRFKGGLITVRKAVRVQPMGGLAARTIGFDDYRGRVGIEGAYGYYLRGRDGKRLEQRIARGIWKPLTDANQVEPQDGADLVTTLDLGMQDVAHHALLETLQKFHADHGCLVVMEVKTGAVKAIVNLGKGQDGTFYERRNYAIFEASEPGSAFKLFTMMAALEDHVIDTTTMVDTQGGVMRYYDNYIRDSHRGGYGVISAKRAFELSSNVGMAKLILQHYQEHPKNFVNRLYKWGLNEKLHLAIPGEGSPKIPYPGGPAWSGLSLPWMAYGYGLLITPLQLLSFYNAVANGGRLLKPRFVKAVLRDGRVEKTFGPELLNPAICSKETLSKMQDLLKGVFLEGTVKALRSDAFSMAGKTGTAQLNYWQKGQSLAYQASFCGYFPADKPKYSCIVVVSKPDPHIGFYGAQVAAPVFKKMAHYAYVNTPRVLPRALQRLAATKPLPVSAGQGAARAVRPNTMPNLSGLPGMQAVSRLENRGFRVVYRGVGRVLEQYPKAGTRISSRSIINLRLQS